MAKQIVSSALLVEFRHDYASCMSFQYTLNIHSAYAPFPCYLLHLSLTSFFVGMYVWTYSQGPASAKQEFRMEYGAVESRNGV